MKNLFKEYQQAADREMLFWPDAEISERKVGKHCRVTLTYEGKSLFVIHPASPSDVRGVHRHVQDIRRTLLKLGATRIARKKA